MIQFSPSMNISYGYGYMAGRTAISQGQEGQYGQVSRLPGRPGQEDRLSEGMGIEAEDRDRVKGLGQEEKKSQEDCQTCKRRRYKDGSDEMVSFKTPTHISPESAASAVRAHEQEHVSNAYAKAATKNGKVVSASVSIHTAICPECGRTYISGGTTHTQIKYYNEDNPYQKSLKSADRLKYSGMNLDYAV